MFSRMLLITLVMTASVATAEVKPHALFSDNAVLQQQMPVPIWGTANDGEKVTVEFQNQKVSTVAAAGQWKVVLQPLSAGGPFELKISGDGNEIVLHNILVGEVWVCSGQSNMMYPLASSEGGPEAIAASKDPLLRLLRMPSQKGIRTYDKPLREPSATISWIESQPEGLGTFGGVVYFFGRDLRKARGVPIGLIQAAEGSSAIHLWTPRHILEDPAYRHYFQSFEIYGREYREMLEAYQKQEPELLKKHEAAVAKAKADNLPVPAPPKPPMDPQINPKPPTSYYATLINPLLPYAIRGVIWYQGENNRGAPDEYRLLFPAMIRAWREAWGQGDFPFLFVQLPSLVTCPPEFREVQLMTSLEVPQTAVVVITDTADPNDGHPRKKEPVGARLALAARGVAYGEKIEYSGPVFSAMKVVGQRALLTFTHVGSGLESKDGALTGFTVAGDNGEFVDAHAEIVPAASAGQPTDTVAVWADKVATPVAVRYGWTDVPVINLFNRESLPASPFRTDSPLPSAKSK